MTTSNVQAPSTHEDVLEQIGRLARAERFRPAPWPRLAPVKTTWLDRLLWRLLSSYRCDGCGRTVLRLRGRARVRATVVKAELLCGRCTR